MASHSVMTELAGSSFAKKKMELIENTVDRNIASPFRIADSAPDDVFRL